MVTVTSVRKNKTIIHDFYIILHEPGWHYPQVHHSVMVSTVDNVYSLCTAKTSRHKSFGLLVFVLKCGMLQILIKCDIHVNIVTNLKRFLIIWPQFGIQLACSGRCIKI